MSAWFNLKLFGPAALALGISTVSLWPERASADVIFDFNSGPCNLEGCPTNTDTATGVLRLTDDYVYGDEVTPATFISMSYSSGDLTLDITSRESPDFFGGLNSDGSFNASERISILGGPLFFSASPGNFTAFGTTAFGPFIENAGSTFTFTNVTAVPEPSTWAMMLIGFAGLGFAGYRRARELRAA
jgi:hypothetical protein